MAIRVCSVVKTCIILPLERYLSNTRYVPAVQPSIFGSLYSCTKSLLPRNTVVFFPKTARFLPTTVYQRDVFFSLPFRFLFQSHTIERHDRKTFQWRPYVGITPLYFPNSSVFAVAGIPYRESNDFKICAAFALSCETPHRNGINRAVLTNGEHSPYTKL